MPNPAGTVTVRRLLILLANEFRRIDRELNVVSMERWRLSAREGAGPLKPSNA